MKEYQEFLRSKSRRAAVGGLTEIPDLAPHLFPFQSLSVAHNLRVGRAGLFHGTGLGKTECQLEWMRHSMNATNGRGLILTPLAVAKQTKRRADKWGYEARVIRDQSDAGDGINICNYERLEKIDPDWYGAVSLDEASILKSFMGRTRNALCDAFAGHRFKLVATATPAPNDHMELGNYAEFLEIMQGNEMLSRWFINDTSSASQNWRLKGHAQRDFWDWMASWSVMAENPSDITGNDDDDANFNLPPFIIKKHRAKGTAIKGIKDGLFSDIGMSATSLHDVKRQTAVARAELAATLATPVPTIFWVDTDYEAGAMKKALPDAVEIRGSMTIDMKEDRLEGFATGEYNHLIAKPSMCGFGLDWSHCADMVFTGRSYSFETFYQAVRRCWRFGQKKQVNVHLIVAEGEDTIGHVLDRKAMGHAVMKSEMVAAMRRAIHRNEADRMVLYHPTFKGRLPKWLLCA